MRLLIGGTRRRRRSTRSSRRPARRSGATSPPSAPSTPASSSRATRVIVSHGDENLDTSELGHDRRDRRIADRRHQDDEVGGQGRSVRLLVAGHRRHARLSDRERLAAEGVRRRDRHASCGRRRSARCRRRRSCWPTASSTSAPRAASSSSSGRAPTARGPERGRAAAQHEQRAAGSKGPRSRFSAGAAVSRGRIFFVSSDAVYAIGPKTAKAVTGIAVDAAGR